MTPAGVLRHTPAYPPAAGPQATSAASAELAAGPVAGVAAPTTATEGAVGGLSRRRLAAAPPWLRAPCQLTRRSRCRGVKPGPAAPPRRHRSPGVGAGQHTPVPHTALTPAVAICAHCRRVASMPSPPPTLG